MHASPLTLLPPVKTSHLLWNSNLLLARVPHFLWSAATCRPGLPPFQAYKFNTAASRPNGHTQTQNPLG